MKDNKPFDLISIGDSTIDTFIRIHEAIVECDLNKQDCKICVPYGAKIPVDSIAYGVAGNAANVACGCARLGLKTAIYTNLGDDDHGERILAAFEKEGINTSFVKTNKGKESNLSVVLTFQGERTIFVYHQDWFYKLPDIGPAKWVYLTSMAESFTNSNIMDEVYRWVKKSGAKLAFGPGTYQLKADIKRYPKLLELCEVFIVNMEEAKKILGIDKEIAFDPRDILSKLLMLGPKYVVVTDGAHGSFGSDGQSNYKVGIVPMEVVEKTGAGDAYTSGLVAALARDEDLAEAMVWGTINSSFVIQHIGTQVGLLKFGDLQTERKKHSDLAAVKF